MRKLLRLWIKGKNFRVKLSKESTDEMSGRMIALKNSIQNGFQRKPRKLDELDHFKATEFRQFAHYTGPVVLKNILPDLLYKHFLCFHASLRLLSIASLSKRAEVINYTTDLLKNFVSDAHRLYGASFISYNVHSLIHIPEDVTRFGPLDTYSLFDAENFLQKIKNLVKRVLRNCPKL
jgi:hypothetical protein